MAATPVVPLAHDVEIGSSAAKIELLVAAGLVLIAAMAAMIGRGPSRLSWGAIVVGFGLLAGAFVVPRVTATAVPVDSEEVFLSIVHPQPGATVSASEAVSVAIETKNAPLGPDAGELRVYVDDRLADGSTSTDFMVHLEPGRRRITVEYANRALDGGGDPVQTSIEVVAE